MPKVTKDERRMTNVNDFKMDPNYVPEDPEKAEIVFQVGYMITDRMDKKLHKSLNYQDPEYWCLDEILTKEEAKFMLSFKKTRTLYNIEELAQMNNMSIEKAQEIVDHLCWTGTVESDYKEEGGVKYYDVPIFVPGIAEFMLMNAALMEKHPNIATFFNLMTQMPLEGLTEMVPLGGSGVGMHVIPVEKAIETENKSLSIEHISHWLDKYKGKMAVGVCSCRRQQRIRGEGSGEIEGEFCIALDNLAEYMVNRQSARYITKEEAIEICERGERHGFVHQITNIDGEDKIVGLCNCAPGVCNALRTSQLFNTPNLSRSAYRAKVDKEKCVACGKCVEVCPVGAAKLGQKLCHADGTAVEYPKTELPDAKKWGPEKWNPNYREDSKINCYETGTSPCKTACPAHLSVQGYVKMASEGRFMDALKLIKQDNPFPAVCGAICNRRCEDACTRGTIDKPVAIDEIKKFIAAQELEADKRYIPLCENDEGKIWEDKKIAVVGAGPAGMSAAFYLRQHGYPVTIFEKESRAGGMLMNGIPNYRLEKNIVQAEIEILADMGVEFKYNTEIGKDITLQSLRNQGYKAFYVAIGAQGGRMTGVPGEDAEGVVTGVDFLRNVNLGNINKMDGDVVVIGGGNVAIDVAGSAVRLTDGHVTMLCLEGEDEMPAAKDEVADAKEWGIDVKNGWGPKEILTENGKVTGIVFKKCTSVKDAEGRFNPQFDEDNTITIHCSNVLLSIGQSIQWGNMLDGTKVELNRNMTAKVDPTTLQTAEPDIFVGGDAYTGPRFAIDAIGVGRIVENSINRFVHPGQSMTINRDLRQFVELDKEDIKVEAFDNADRQAPGMKSGNPVETFSDLRATFTEEQVETEAKRCLGCGATTIDENRCIGCGLCTTKCEFDAIHLNRDLPDASHMRRTEDKLKGVLPYAAKRQFKIIFNGNK